MMATPVDRHIYRYLVREMGFKPSYMVTPKEFGMEIKDHAQLELEEAIHELARYHKKTPAELQTAMWLWSSCASKIEKGREPSIYLGERKVINCEEMPPEEYPAEPWGRMKEKELLVKEKKKRAIRRRGRGKILRGRPKFRELPDILLRQFK